MMQAVGERVALAGDKCTVVGRCHLWEGREELMAASPLETGLPIPIYSANPGHKAGTPRNPVGLDGFGGLRAGTLVPGVLKRRPEHWVRPFRAAGYILLRRLSMKLRPLHDRVVIRRVEEETKTAGGILLPGSAAEKPSQGEVVAAGKGAVAENGTVRQLDVKVGDKVLFGQYSGSTVKVNGEELLIMKESEIFAVLEA